MIPYDSLTIHMAGFKGTDFGDTIVGNEDVTAFTIMASVNCTAMLTVEQTDTFDVAVYS